MSILFWLDCGRNNGKSSNDNSITVTAIEFEKHLCSQNGKYIRASCRTIRRSIIQSNTEEGFKALICFV
jgi:hypothetical protein